MVLNVDVKSTKEWQKLKLWEKRGHVVKGQMKEHLFIVHRKRVEVMDVDVGVSSTLV